MSVCPQCGATLAPEDPFCGHCGAPQQAQAAESAAAEAGAATIVAPFPSKENDPWDTASGDEPPAKGAVAEPVLSESQLDETISPEESKRAAEAASKQKSTGEIRREEDRKSTRLNSSHRT